MSVTTIYIRPAMTDQAGQCRVYSTQAEIKGHVGRHYSENPHLWKEVGLMNSRGQLVCFSGPGFQHKDLVINQPLMAGTTFSYDEYGVAA